MTLSTINKGWAVTQATALVLTFGGAGLLPLVASAHEHEGGHGKTTIHIVKIIDQDGDLNTKDDQTPGIGWDFTVGGDITVTTDEQGHATARVNRGSHDVVEIAQDGFTLVSGSCRYDKKPPREEEDGPQNLTLQESDEEENGQFDHGHRGVRGCQTDDEDTDENDRRDHKSVTCTFYNAPVDLCLNLNGVQTEVPQGMEVNSDHFCTPIPPACNPQASQTIVSDTTTRQGDHAAVPVGLPLNARWTAVVPGATWIWGEDPIADAVNQTSETFTRTFSIVGTPTGATLDVAADNGYSVSVNGHAVGSDPTEFNYQSVADDASTNPDHYTIPAGNLLTGTNTITFTVTNMAQAQGTPSSNPGGLLYKLVVNNNECVTPPPPVCHPEVNLVDNGGFESPDVSTGAYDIVAFTNTLLKWTGEWASAQTGGRLGLEIQDHVAGTPASGAQHAELDGDHPVNIWQDIVTVPGQKYDVSFKYSPRPGRSATDNQMEFRVGGALVGAVLSADGTANSDTVWTTETRTFTATGATTRVGFYDTGTDTSYGGYLDDVSVTCVPPVQEPSVTVVAAKVVCTNESDLPNWGVGGPDITATTASDWVAAHQSCHLENGWSFEWGNQSAGDAGRDFVGHASGYTTFGPTVAGVTSTTIPLSALGTGTEFHLREVLKEGYIPFTFDQAHQSNANNVSAEFYCSNDVLNYDNYDFIRNPLADNTYYCVAWNVPTNQPEDPVCSVDEQLVNHQCVPKTCEDSNQHWDTEVHRCVNNTPTDPTCGTGQHLENHSCVNNPTSTSSSSGSGGGGGGGGGCGIGFTWSPSLLRCVPKTGQVLGVSCGLYMDQHLKKGSPKNNPEQVRKLQGFLNKHGFGTFTPTGYFGPLTESAVNAFQLKYSADVLQPWGISSPTGLVYLSTIRHINLLECPDLSLPLPPLVDWNRNPNPQ